MDDLSLIRKYYGEKMMHLCRELFPTLLEEKGLLYNLISSNFAHSKFLYEDIIEQSMVDHFKDYIYSFIDNDEKLVETDKPPFELMDDAGYILYECKTEEEIQFFKKYYAPGEELCTFNDTRLDSNYVFFAVKKNVSDIKRAENPQRQDEYGTSVISIQFTRGNVNTLSIKNRYNHRVGDPDATFSNNLENIIPGLTYSFTKNYNLNINQEINSGLILRDYVKANDGKRYRYNNEILGNYYCVNNLIVDVNRNVNIEYSQQPERYLLLDYFLLDMKEKTIKSLSDFEISDSFVNDLINIEKINIIKNKENGNKTIEIKIKDKDNLVYIEIDKYNNIIGYINNNIIEIGDYFLSWNKTINKLITNNVKFIGSSFMSLNNSIKELSFPNLILFKDSFLYNNNSLQKLNVPKLLFKGKDSFFNNTKIKMYVELIIMKNVTKRVKYIMENKGERNEKNSKRF